MVSPGIFAKDDASLATSRSHDAPSKGRENRIREGPRARDVPGVLVFVVVPAADADGGGGRGGGVCVVFSFFRSVYCLGFGAGGDLVAGAVGKEFGGGCVPTVVGEDDGPDNAGPPRPRLGWHAVVGCPWRLDDPELLVLVRAELVAPRFDGLLSREDPLRIGPWNVYA